MSTPTRKGSPPQSTLIELQVTGEKARSADVGQGQRITATQPQIELQVTGEKSLFADVETAMLAFGGFFRLLDILGLQIATRYHVYISLLQRPRSVWPFGVPLCSLYMGAAIAEDASGYHLNAHGQIHDKFEEFI